MKKYEKYKNWLLTFVFIVAILAVYKTFDNFSRVKEFLKTVIDFHFSDYDKKNPLSEIEELYERINKFKIDKNVTSKNKLTE